MSIRNEIAKRNVKIQEEYLVLRLDKSKKQPEHIQELADKYGVSVSTIDSVLYRKGYAKKPNT